jgi:hypothetical protein
VTTTHNTESPPKNFRINTEINIGTVIQAVTAIAIAITFFYSMSFKADKNYDHMMSVESSVGQMKVDLLEKITSIQQDNNRRFDDLSRQVAGLPDQTTTIRLLDSRMSRVEGQLPGMDRRIGEMHDTVLQDHSDIQAIQSANKPKLGGNNR